ncbi:MAG: alkaline phosphatase family protein, partial [Phycisphaerae bacterium]
AYLRIISARDIRCPTLWSLLHGAGLRVGSLNYVAHSPAPKIDGYVIPGWVPWRWIKKHSHPADLIDRLKDQLPEFDLQDLAMNFKEEEKAVAGAQIEEFEPWVDLHIRREKQWFNILRHQLQHDRTKLTGIVFDGVDKIQHLMWPFLDPSLEPDNPSDEFVRARQRCWDYFNLIDGFLAETVDIVGDDGHVFVVSDHGFSGSTEIIYINTWLEQQGYLTWSDVAKVESSSSQELGDAHPYHLTHMDLSRTRAYAASASSNGIHINVAGDRGDQGIAPGDYEAFRQELIEALLTRCVDPQTSEPLVTQVWTREEIFDGPRIGFAPDLTLAFRDHGFFSILRSDAVLKARSVPMGTHHPEGVWMANGPGVRRGAQFGPMEIVDVAPTVMYLLGQPIPEDFEGRVATDMLTPQYLEGHRVVNASGANQDAAPVPAADEAMADDQESKAQVMMRLRALGYLE